MKADIPGVLSRFVLFHIQPHNIFRFKPFCKDFKGRCIGVLEVVCLCLPFESCPEYRRLDRSFFADNEDNKGISFVANIFSQLALEVWANQNRILNSKRVDYVLPAPKERVPRCPHKTPHNLA